LACGPFPFYICILISISIVTCASQFLLPPYAARTVLGRSPLCLPLAKPETGPTAERAVRLCLSHFHLVDDFNIYCLTSLIVLCGTDCFGMHFCNHFWSYHQLRTQIYTQSAKLMPSTVGAKTATRPPQTTQRSLNKPQDYQQAIKTA